MKIVELFEMTKRATHSLDDELKDHLTTLSPEESGEFIGHIDNFDVHKEHGFIYDLYSIFDNDDAVGYAQVMNIDGTPMVQSVYIQPQYRKQSIFSKFISFLFKETKSEKIAIGDVHSPDMQSVINSLKHTFHLGWLNFSTGETHQYSENHYSTDEPSGWHVTLSKSHLSLVK